MKIKLSIIPEKVYIHTPFIKLDSFLKLGFNISGGEAKLAAERGQVNVNGEICTARGKKLSAGDRVLFNGRLCEVTDDENNGSEA